MTMCWYAEQFNVGEGHMEQQNYATPACFQKYQGILIHSQPLAKKPQSEQDSV